jgi:hypothetical protein
MMSIVQSRNTLLITYQKEYPNPVVMSQVILQIVGRFNQKLKTSENKNLVLPLKQKVVIRRTLDQFHCQFAVKQLNPIFRGISHFLRQLRDQIVNN